MADQDENKVNPTPDEQTNGDLGENPGLNEAAEASPHAEPQGEVAVDGETRADVLGEEQDGGFDAVAHGQQTALENHQAEKRAQPSN